MAFDYHDTFERIVAKANLLAQRYKILDQGKRELEERLNEMEQQMAAKDKELQNLRSEVEYLRVASVLAPSREQIENTRAIISGLVRDIDRCIADITE